MNAEKQVIVIALITAICLCGDMMLYIVLPIYWEEFGLTSLWQVGVLLSANRFIRLPLNPFIGWLYQRISKRTGVLIAVILAMITTLSYGFLKGFWVLLLMRCLWGIAWSFLRLGGFLTILDVADKANRGFLIGRYNGLWGLGGLTGMLAGGLLADVIGIKAVALIFAVAVFCSIPFVIRYIPKHIGTGEKRASSAANAKPFWRQSYVIPVMITGIIIAMAFQGIYMSTLSQLVEEKFSAQNLSFFGMVIGSATLAGIIQAVRWGWDPFLAPRLGLLSDGKRGRMPYLTTALIFGAGLFSILSFKLPFFLWILALFSLQLTWTLGLTIADSLAADVASKSSGVAIITTYTVVADVGAAVGPSFSFLMIDLFNIEALYWVTGGLLLGLGLFWMFQSRRNSLDLL